MFFNFFGKQGKGVVYIFIRAFLFFKNLNNIVKQCVGYSNFTIFLNIWKILVFNHKICMIFFIVYIFFCYYAESHFRKLTN